MKVIKYSEAELFSFAFKNAGDKELLEILIKDFGLDVNWRDINFYDTLLYQSLKENLDAAKFLISKGACVNASLGGYPENDNSHGYMSILDAAQGFYTIKEAGGPSFLKQFGAISFLNLPEEKKQQIIETVDFTKEASDGRNICRSSEQVKLSVMMAPEKVKQKLIGFINGCDEELIDEAKIDNKNSR